MALSIDARGSMAILRGPWLVEYRPEFERAKPTRLIVHAAPDLEFLRDLPPLLGLEVHHLPLADIRPIESQPSLQTLSINAYFKVGIDFSTLPGWPTFIWTGDRAPTRSSPLVISRTSRSTGFREWT
jgi:hypothetical protein